MQITPVDHAPVRDVLEGVEMAGVGLIVPDVERVVIHNAPTDSTQKEAAAGGVVTLFGRVATPFLAGFCASVLNAIALRASGFFPSHHGLIEIHLHGHNTGDDMTNGEARALEREFNETVARGRVLWEEATSLADRCNAIREKLDAADVEYDQIALLFGGELQLDLVGPDDKDVKA